MFFVSTVVHVFSNITTADPMDVILMREIDKMSPWAGKKTYCWHQWDEDNYKDPIKILMASHLILFLILHCAAYR